MLSMIDLPTYTATVEVEHIPNSDNRIVYVKSPELFKWLDKQRSNACLYTEPDEFGMVIIAGMDTVVRVNQMYFAATVKALVRNLIMDRLLEMVSGDILDTATIELPTLD